MNTPLVAAFLAFGCALMHAQTWQSAIVQAGTGGALVYATDNSGNRIPDFSHAGFRNGGVPLPALPTVLTLGPAPGDNTARIQAQLDSLARRSPDASGYRGALLLTAGLYEINGTLTLRSSGVVLRGVGDGSDPATNTVLLGKGDVPHQRSIIVAGGGSSSRWKEQISGRKTDIISDTVKIAERRFRVTNPAVLAVGDNIVIYHPCTDAWLAAIDYGGTHWTEPGAEAGVDVPWTVNSQPIVFNRYITRIAGDTIVVDAPVFNHLVRALSQSYVYKYARTGLLNLIGVEHLRIDIETAGGEDENHAWNALAFTQVEDCWIVDCTALHFGHAGFMTQTATRVTIDSCSALDPVSIITGERRYNYDMSDASQLILVSNCIATHGRHDFVSNGTSYTSGCVFVDCRSTGAYASSEGHRRWSMALLYDNVAFASPNDNVVLGLYNRGHYGTSHGWAVAHAVAWNCDAGSAAIIIQRPPTAQNYAIGCRGIVKGTKPPAPFSEPEGYIEGTGQSGLQPRSLYYAQLADRLGTVNSVGYGSETQSPAQWQLHPAFPNPFNGTTTISFSLPGPAHVRLAIVDLLGRQVAVLVDGLCSGGSHSARWEPSNSGSGIYFCRLETGGGTRGLKIVHLR